MFQAVVFDMDGLMFDTERMIQRSWDVVGVRMGFGKMGKDIYHTLGLNNAERERYFKDTYEKISRIWNSGKITGRRCIGIPWKTERR